MRYPRNTMGRYARYNNLEGYGVCANSGLPIDIQNMQFQMQWTGNSLTSNGQRVGAMFADIPNEQGKVPPIKSDPTPIQYARPPVNNQAKTPESNDIILNPATMPSPETAYRDGLSLPSLDTTEAMKQLDNNGFNSNNIYNYYYG